MLVSSAFNLKSNTNVAAIDVAAAPDMIPHTSPITSQQKLDTLSAFFLNLTAMLAPFTFLELIEWNTFSSADVTDTPIMSNSIPRNTKNKVTIIPSHNERFGIVVSEIKIKKRTMNLII